MKLLGQIVLHKNLGEGIIVDEKILNNNIYIKVNFITEIKEFAFPGIFLTAYMRFKNDNVQNEFKKSYCEKSSNSTKLINDKNLQKNIQDIQTPEKYEKEYNSIRQLKVIASHYSHLKPLLKASLLDYYGGNSQEIYLECCNIFGWESYFSDNFGRQGSPLFAENATREGYAVWFLAHSNYTENMQNNTWINKISDNKEIIYELWNDNSKQFDKGTRRIVFAKTSNAKYIFLGVYEVITKVLLENGSRLRIFKRVSENYPIKNGK